MDKNIWQPYLQTRAEYLPEDKSVTMATDLKQMNDTELVKKYCFTYTESSKK